MCDLHGLDSRSAGMSGGQGGTKTVFPLSLPLSGQTLLFPGPPNASLARCDSHGRCNLSSMESRSRCSCDKLHSHSAPATTNNGLSRVLLPVSPPGQAVTSSFNALNTSALSDPWLRIASAASRSNYESLILSGFPLYGKFATDDYPSLDYALLANARRKNATRETTSTLKNWLNEHRKNPYPTKGEKIMLAILTKMTLTQVSTWFANARRRLKKENKMTWSPRKKTGEQKSGGLKGDNASDGDSDIADDDDAENMEINIDVEEDKPDPPMPELVPAGRAQTEPDSFANERAPSISSGAASQPQGLQRASVIRTMDSPTFDEIKSRFKDDDSPVNNLQKWVNGCFATEEPADYPRELTPPSTPVEDRVSPLSQQKLFAAFSSKNEPPALLKVTDASTLNDPPPPILESFQKESCRTVADEVLHPDPSQSVMTPQPSPRTSTTCSPVVVDEGVSATKPAGCASTSNDDSTQSAPGHKEVRTQGLTTSREIEAVLALATLFNT